MNSYQTSTYLWNIMIWIWILHSKFHCSQIIRTEFHFFKFSNFEPTESKKKILITSTSRSIYEYRHYHETLSKHNFGTENPERLERTNSAHHGCSLLEWCQRFSTAKLFCCCRFLKSAAYTVPTPSYSQLVLNTIRNKSIQIRCDFFQASIFGAEWIFKRWNDEFQVTVHSEWIYLMPRLCSLFLFFMFFPVSISLYYSVRVCVSFSLSSLSLFSLLSPLSSLSLFFTVKRSLLIFG